MFQEEEAEEEDHFGLGVFNRARKFIWELFEEPNKSKLGKVARGGIYRTTGVLGINQIFCKAAFKTQILSCDFTYIWGIKDHCSKHVFPLQNLNKFIKYKKAKQL